MSIYLEELERRRRLGEALEYQRVRDAEERVGTKSGSILNLSQVTQRDIESSVGLEVFWWVGWLVGGFGRSRSVIWLVLVRLSRLEVQLKLKSL